jgi:hypothetical protein
MLVSCAHNAPSLIPREPAGPIRRPVFGLVCQSLAGRAQSKPAVSILLCAEPKARTHLNEVNIETQVSTTKLAQALASKILKIYPPALFAR